MSDDEGTSRRDVVKEDKELHVQLDEMREVLTAIRTGSVDALVIKGPKGEQIYTLQGAEFPYRVFVEHMSEGALTFDEDGTIIYANHRFAELVGVPLDKIIGGKLPRFVLPADRSRCEELIREANGEPSRRELNLVSESGEVIHVLLSARHLPNESGRFYCSIVSDLRGQRLQEFLRQSEERLRLATTAAAVGIWEWDVRSNLIRWDAQMFEIYGAISTADRLVPYAMWSNAVVPDDLPEQERILWETVHNRGSSRRTFRIRRYSDGKERYVEAVETVLTDAQGKTELVIGTNIDVTEHKEADQALAEHQRLLKSVTDNASVALFIMDHRQHCVFMNPAAETLTGFRVQQVRGRPLHEFVHHTRQNGRPYPLQECPIDQVLPKQHRMQGEETFIHPDGRFYDVAFTASPIPGPRGKAIGTIIEVQDITERKALDNQVRSFTQQLEALVQERTQELLQLQDRLRALAIELNLTEQRERKRLATELHDYLAQLLVVGKMYLDRIEPEAGAPLFHKLGETLDEALTYTRTLVAQLSPPFFQEFGLPYAFKWLAEQMQTRGLRLTVEVRDGSLVLTEDHATLLFQAARELLMNVLKHAGTDYARLAMTMAEGTVRIEISDDGRGFDVDALGSASAIGTQGRFGLFSIRERMIAMGGRFELVSRPGTGTRATLVVPLNCAADVRIEESRASTELTESQDSAFRPQNSPGSLEKIRALLVDDHAMVRQGLRSILEAYADMEIVGEASAGDEALALVDQLRPSVVVMDINMPRMNGIEATAKIKARHAGVVVIGLSVQTDEFARTEMLRAGATTLMTKEAAVEELYHTIQRELQERTSN